MLWSIGLISSRFDSLKSVIFSLHNQNPAILVPNLVSSSGLSAGHRESKMLKYSISNKNFRQGKTFGPE